MAHFSFNMHGQSQLMGVSTWLRGWSCNLVACAAWAGMRGMFTGYWPTLLEDVPDMAFKFAAYESMRSLHRRLSAGRPANVQV